MKYSIISVVIFLVTVMGVHLTSADEVLLSDTFSTNETRTAGTSLNGDEIEFGGSNWATAVNAVFVSSAEDAWSSYEGNFMYARVPLPSVDGVDILEWKIDAQVRGTQADGGVPKGYLALGRSDFDANIREGVRLTIQNNGNWAVGYHNGSTYEAIGSGSVLNDGEYKGFFPNTLKVQYNFNDDTLSAWINSNQVVSAYDMTGKPITFGAAGWVTQNNVNQLVRYDNFSVSSIEAALPTNVTAKVESIVEVSPSVMELVVSTANPAISYPKVLSSLNLTNWTGVAHSTNGLAPFIVTNLSYSAASGTNYAIYVEAADSEQFYKIGGE